MSEPRDPGQVTVRDYLASEVRSPARREYVGGVPYAMAGARNGHNLIASNLLIALGLRLRGSRCRAFNSDTKLRVRLGFETRFYYPDAMVVCRQNPADETFQDEPVLIAEVVSADSRRVDEGEKLLAYRSVPAMLVYLLLEQDLPRAVVYRRQEHDLVREGHAGLQAVVPLPELRCELPLAELYDGLEPGADGR